jgi:hypothetical protein
MEKVIRNGVALLVAEDKGIKAEHGVGKWLLISRVFGSQCKEKRINANSVITINYFCQNSTVVRNSIIIGLCCLKRNV